MRVLGLDFRYQLAIIALFHYILDMVEDQAKLCELNSVGNPMPGHLGDDVDNGYCQSHEPLGTSHEAHKKHPSTYLITRCPDIPNLVAACPFSIVHFLG